MYKVVRAGTEEEQAEFQYLQWHSSIRKLKGKAAWVSLDATQFNRKNP